jgi:sugar (pentulose or hexulose) kinase
LLRGKLADLRATGCAPAKIQLAGGGSQHPAWRRLLADALGVPLYPSGNGWLTARGAALIAAMATGMLPPGMHTRPARETEARETEARETEAVVGKPALAEASYRRFCSAASRMTG